MKPLDRILINKETSFKPIWIMRQAGRYLPEFREIRKENPDFIKLCLNQHLSSEITLQPLRRFNFDAAIIFSDILMIPFGLNQKVEFKKNIGPILGDINFEQILELDEINFINKISPIYEALNLISKNKLTKNKNIIGFVGAPLTLLVYMINKQSPKSGLNNNFFNNDPKIKQLLLILDKFIKLHIKKQIDNGAEIIQIFDSWAGLVEEKNLEKLIYLPTLKLVEYTKSLNVPVICFPRNIKNYKKYCDIINPSAVCIDYETDPLKIIKNIKIPIQGGMDPKILLSDKENLKNEAKKYLDIFKDHPYIFNLGHGVLPETDPGMMDYLVKMVKDY